MVCWLQLNRCIHQNIIVIENIGGCEYLFLAICEICSLDFFNYFYFWRGEERKFGYEF